MQTRLLTSSWDQLLTSTGRVVCLRRGTALGNAIEANHPTLAYRALSGRGLLLDTAEAAEHMRAPDPACHALPQASWFAQSSLVGAANAGECDMRIVYPIIPLPALGTSGGWITASTEYRERHLNSTSDAAGAVGAGETTRSCNFLLTDRLDTHLHALVANGRLRAWRAAQLVRLRDPSNTCTSNGAPDQSATTAGRQPSGGTAASSSSPMPMGTRAMAGPLSLLALAIGTSLLWSRCDEVDELVAHTKRLRDGSRRTLVAVRASSKRLLRAAGKSPSTQQPKTHHTRGAGEDATQADVPVWQEDADASNRHTDTYSRQHVSTRADSSGGDEMVTQLVPELMQMQAIQARLLARLGHGHGAATDSAPRDANNALNAECHAPLAQRLEKLDLLLARVIIAVETQPEPPCAPSSQHVARHASGSRGGDDDDRCTETCERSGVPFLVTSGAPPCAEAPATQPTLVRARTGNPVRAEQAAWLDAAGAGEEVLIGLEQHELPVRQVRDLDLAI